MPILFWSNIDPQSTRAKKILYRNKVLVKEYEWHKDRDVFEKYGITETPTLLVGKDQFVGAEEIELCLL